MKTSAQIRFDFSNALSQATKLEQLAEQTDRTVVREMEQQMEQMRSVWTGESARRFIQKSGEFSLQVEESAQELRKIAEDIRRIARIVYEAEMSALEIAQRRNH